MFVATHKETDDVFAVKHIKKYEVANDLFTWEQQERLLLREVDTLRRVTGCSKGVYSPHLFAYLYSVVELLELYEDDDDIFLVFELYV